MSEVNIDALSAENKSLQEKVKALEAETAELTAKLEALESAVKEQKATKQKPGGKTLPEFEINKARYRFRVGGFSFDGVKGILATEAVKDKTLLKKIVEEYPGLVEVL